MASQTPKRRPQLAPQSEVVDPRWLLKALGLTLLVAALFGYLTVCFLVYQGSWQSFLKPSAVIDKTPATHFDSLRFDAAETGLPRLAGWWIPSDSPAALTILFLHDGDGSLSTVVPTLDLLHQTGVNIFAFDYRGFGQSDPTHPGEARMNEDAIAALRYLLETRHLNASTIIPYGQGLGAVFAAHLAAANAAIPAIIIDTPDPDIYTRNTGASRASLLPMKLLVRERFDLASPLYNSHKPKLLLADSPFTSDAARTAANQAFFHNIPDPKLTVTFTTNAAPAYLEAIRRFLDQYVGPSINNLNPKAPQP